MSVFNYLGWVLADLLGFEIFGCFILSGLVSLIGVWIGWRVASKLGM